MCTARETYVFFCVRTAALCMAGGRYVLELLCAWFLEGVLFYFLFYFIFCACKKRKYAKRMVVIVEAGHFFFSTAYTWGPQIAILRMLGSDSSKKCNWVHVLKLLLMKICTRPVKSFRAPPFFQLLLKFKQFNVSMYSEIKA